MLFDGPRPLPSERDPMLVPVLILFSGDIERLLPKFLPPNAHPWISPRVRSQGEMPEGMNASSTLAATGKHFIGVQEAPTCSSGPLMNPPPGAGAVIRAMPSLSCWDLLADATQPRLLPVALQLPKRTFRFHLPLPPSSSKQNTFWLGRQSA